MNIKKLLPGVKENIPLNNFATFRIGGPARYFFIAKTKKDAARAVRAAKKLNLPFFVLGGGSNLLVSDSGFNGLVIKIKNQKLKIKNSNLIVDAGVSLSRLVGVSTEDNLAGLEWASGIPGTLGGAIYGNAGATEKMMGDVVKEVEVFDSAVNKIKKIKKRDCQFAYRNSVFKKNKNLIILSAGLQLKKGDKKDIEGKVKGYISQRINKQPLEFPSAGSVFKNHLPRLDGPLRQSYSEASESRLGKSKIKNQKLLNKFPALKNFNRNGLIPAAWLIERCGLKGKKIGGAQISEKHANFIINLGRAKAKDAISLIKLAKQKVKNKFGVELEEEVQYLGFKNYPPATL